MTTTKAPPSSTRTIVAALVVVVAGVFPIHLTGALAPDIQASLGFGDGALGLVISSMFALSALITVAGGSFTDRHPQRALRIGALFSAAGMGALALAPSLPLFVLAMLLTTPGNAISQPGANVLIAEGVAVRRRGMALGIKQSAIAVSTTAAGVASLALVSSVSWRGVYAVGIVTGLVAFAVLPDVRRIDVSGDMTMPLAIGSDERAASDAMDVAIVRAAAIAGFCGSAAVSSIGTFLVRAAQDAGFSIATGRWLLTGGSVLLLVLRIVLGWLADRGTIEAAPTAWKLLLAGTIGYLLLSTGSLLGFVFGAILTFGAGWSWPGLLFLAVVRRFPHAAGRPSAKVQRGMFMGAVLGPAMFGAVAESVSFRAAWWMSAMWGLCAAAAVFAVDKAER